MKLYHSSGSPNSRRVRILIAEKGLDIELSPVDLGAKEQFSDAYRAINPRAVVPTLVLDDGTAIGEVPAIMRYLDEAYPKVPLLGATPKEKALITMWERRAELEGFAPVILPELKAVIDATPSGQLVYLVTDFGKPFTAAGFGNKFRDWCNEAGLKHCTAHGCRKAGAKMAAENGATAHQLMAIFGWETLRQAEVYTRSANRTLLAEQAMHLLVRREKNKSGPELSHFSIPANECDKNGS